jgi:hypothetical protein
MNNTIAGIKTYFDGLIETLIKENPRDYREWDIIAKVVRENGRIVEMDINVKRMI